MQNTSANVRAGRPVACTIRRLTSTARAAARRIAVWLCVLSLTTVPIAALTPPAKTEAATPPAAAVADTPEMSRIKTGAAAFSNAIRQLSNLPLSTERDIRQAIEVLKKNDAILRSNYFSRMVQIALDNSTFRRSIESRLAKTSAKELSQQFQRDKEMVQDFPGARQAEQKIREQIRSDAAVLERIGKRLQDVSRNKRAGLRERPLAPAVMFAKASFLPERSNFTDANPASPGEPAAFACEAVCLALIAAAVLLIGAYAAAKGEDLLDKPRNPPGDITSPRDNRSDFKVCIDRSYERREACLKGCDKDFWCESGCWGVYTLDMSACVLLPQ